MVTLPPPVRVLLASILLATSLGAWAQDARGPVVRIRPGDPWPDLVPGMTVSLIAGRYDGPWEIGVNDVTIEGEGATIVGPPRGSILTLIAEGITVRNVTLRDGGSVADLYAPDAAAWLLDCHGCALERITTSGTPAAVRIEASREVVLRDSQFQGAAEGPGVTTYEAPGLTLERLEVRGFLDGLYLERSDDTRIREVTVRNAARYGLHVMFSAGIDIEASDVSGGGVGSAVMYGRDARLTGNRFRGHEGPLAYGLLLHEMTTVHANQNTLDHNTVGALVVSSRAVTIEDNDLRANGTGLLVQRSPSEIASEMVVTANRFQGNVADLAVDDPEAAVTLRANAYDRASPLDRNRDGISDAALLPTSTFAVLQSRQPDLSLFAFSPGVELWEAAEASVPALRLATLHDPTPLRLPSTRPGAPPASTWLTAAGVLLAVAMGVVPTWRPVGGNRAPWRLGRLGLRRWGWDRSKPERWR